MAVSCHALSISIELRNTLSLNAFAQRVVRVHRVCRLHPPKKLRCENEVVAAKQVIKCRTFFSGALSMIRGVTSRFTICIALALSSFGRPIGAQSLAGEVRQSRFETRAQLESAMRTASTMHRDGEAVLLQWRLQQGDFQDGDRIVLTLEIPTVGVPDNAITLYGSRVDTAVIRSGRMLEFTKLLKVPDLSLDGVLRSELVDTISSYLGKYVRNARVHAVPLLRVGVMGAVGRPGWYLTSSDAVIADVIMQAGGVSADGSNTVIRRAGKEIWSADNVRIALSDGLSLDRLNLKAGDEIFVTPKRQWSLGNSLQLLSAAVGVFGVYLATRSAQRHN
jgi:hypothetical protein